VTGELACERAQLIIPNLEKLLDAAREADVPVFYVGDAHFAQDCELGVWGEHAIKGTEGAEVIPELEPQEGDYVLEKRTYSSFYETGLDDLLRANDVDRVLITGLHTHMCCRHSAAGAFFRGYDITVVEDGCQAFEEEDHQSGLEYMEEVYGADVRTTDEIVDEWLN
jgi:nicotinamidase-related amidase